VKVQKKVCVKESARGKETEFVREREGVCVSEWMLFGVECTIVMRLSFCAPAAAERGKEKKKREREKERERG